MSWTALVALKAAAERKSRLADTLSPAERVALADAMLIHVGGLLARHGRIDRALLIAYERHPHWPGDWCRDEGRGLNAELEAAAAGIVGGLIVLHADLPLVADPDLDALIVGGTVLAPDRHGRGTNAVALGDGRDFAGMFGDDSLARFRARWPDATIVRREGLSLDIDTVDDLARAEAAGFRWCQTG